MSARRNAMVSVRLTASELAQIQRICEVGGLSVSDYMRRMALAADIVPALRCEREDCDEPALTYYGFGRSVSNRPWNSASGGLQPDQPIDLCASHALDAFGVAFETSRSAS